MNRTDVSWASAFIKSQDWHFSTTMPQWPHSYIIRGEGNRAADFDRLAALVKRHGEDDKWGRETRRYLRVGDFKYWVMGEVINRGEPIPSSEVRRRGEEWLRRHRKKIGPYGHLVSVKKRNGRSLPGDTLGESTRRPYKLVKDLVRSVGGRMTWKSGGTGGGGVWNVVLPQGVARIDVRRNEVNALDRLYKPHVRKPKKWDDFFDELVWDAAAKLKRLVQ
jgi:hypothetical protein